MNKDLESLVKLQKLDGQIVELQKEAQEYRDATKKWRSEFDDKNNDYTKNKTLYDEMRKEQKRTELDAMEVDVHMEKLKSKMYEVKSQKEMDAWEANMSKSKIKKSELEEKSIKLLDDIEKLKARIEADGEAIQKEEKELSEVENEYKERIAAKDGEIKELNAAKQEVFSAMDPYWMGQYKRLNSRGNAIIKLEKGICQGCFMKVTPQINSEVRKNDKIIRCENCARILYSEE